MWRLLEQASRKRKLRNHQKSSTLPPVNVILFGEPGAGKSSLINLFARKNLAALGDTTKSWSDLHGNTMDSRNYCFIIDGTKYTIFETTGLEKPQMGVNGYMKAFENMFKLISELEDAGGVHLLLFCIRQFRITATTLSNYRLFYETLCRKKVPIALVFTALENEANLEEIWTRNRTCIERYGMKSQGHACVGAWDDENSREISGLNESQEKIRCLIKSCALEKAASLPGSRSWFATVAKGMMSFVNNHSDPGRKELVKILTQRCHLTMDDAEMVLDAMDECNLELSEDDAAQEGTSESKLEPNSALKEGSENRVGVTVQSTTNEDKIKRLHQPTIMSMDSDIEEEMPRKKLSEAPKEGLENRIGDLVQESKKDEPGVTLTQNDAPIWRSGSAERVVSLPICENVEQAEDGIPKEDIQEEGTKSKAKSGGYYDLAEGFESTVKVSVPEHFISYQRPHPTLQEPDIQISDNAFDSWKLDQLVDTEKLLTVAIGSRSQDSSYHALASRAFVRIRLRQWDTAIDDAEQSLRIQPSVAGYIAKTLALVCKGEKDKGYRTCDIAFEHFHSTHVSFLLLMKAIIIFMAGDHKDAILRMDDLIAAIQSNSLFYMVQAYMYLLLGNSEMEREDYDTALKTFERAQTRVKHHESRHLVVVSLISGWKFDHLEITIRQRHCEALYAAGRIEEGATSLLELLDTFEEDVYLNGPNVEWVSDFTQRCLSTPECNRDTPPDLVQTPVPLLREWAKATLTSGPWNDALATAANFKTPRFAIYRALCERLETIDHILDASECFYQMTSELEKEKESYANNARWVRDFKLRCCEKLEILGDEEIIAQQYNKAIARYSAALSHNPDYSQGLLIKRGKVLMIKELWDEALNDVNEAITRDPSSPSGYEAKHAILHGAKRYSDAVEAFEMMLSYLEDSSDPQLREYCDQYISPSSVRATIHKIVHQVVHCSPRVLINTSTGRLQSRNEQAASFESLPVFNELLSSMTTRVDRGWIKREVKHHYRYAMLSHRWEDNEPLFQLVTGMAVYELEKSLTHDKLKTFCETARDAGFNWAWSDTCCIDKQDHFALQEALVAMFKWYRDSALVIVYLRGVRSPGRIGDLGGSTWNTRSWTLQEYVAGNAIHFYTEDWSLYLDLKTPNHKESREIMLEMEQAAGLSAERLVGLRPGLDNIREKLCLASSRQTTLIEDEAYSLLGIFSVNGISAIYGEGENALGRLLAHILSDSGDISILAWTGFPSSVNSCLPARISVYSGPATSHLPTRLDDAEMEKWVTKLRGSAVDLNLAVRLYDKINKFRTARFAASRMSLPCITFKLPSFKPYQTSAGRVYRVESLAFGPIEIKAKRDLSRLKNLYIVHPWMDALLGREDTHDTFVEDEIMEPSLLGTDIEDDSSFISKRELPSPEGMDTVTLDRETCALQLIARLRQPFGALLFALASRNGREEYRRVVSDVLITVQLQESLALEELVENTSELDVL